jgi:hypothetical protein
MQLEKARLFMNVVELDFGEVRILGILGSFLASDLRASHIFCAQFTPNSEKSLKTEKS